MLGGKGTRGNHHNFFLKDKRERENRLQERRHFSPVYTESKRIRATEMKCRGLMAISELTDGVPQETKKALTLEKQGQSMGFTDRKV